MPNRRGEHADVPGLPAAPRTVEETGLALLLISELALKVMHQHGLNHLQELSTHLRLSAALLDTLFSHLRKETLVEIRRRGALDGDVEYQLTQSGRTRAAEALARNLYSGPAPVPVAAYAARVEAQSVGAMGVTQGELEQALAGGGAPRGDQLARQCPAARHPAGRPPGARPTLCEQMVRLLTATAVPTRSRSTARSSACSTRWCTGACRTEARTRPSTAATAAMRAGAASARW
jgi:DNA-binding PadR family transcriptional regulator